MVRAVMIGARAGRERTDEAHRPVRVARAGSFCAACKAGEMKAAAQHAAMNVILGVAMMVSLRSFLGGAQLYTDSPRGGGAVSLTGTDNALLEFPLENRFSAILGSTSFTSAQIGGDRRRSAAELNSFWRRSAAESGLTEIVRIWHDAAVTASMLSPYRVLDLTDERGLLCGQHPRRPGRGRAAGRAAGGQYRAPRRALLSRRSRSRAQPVLVVVRGQQAQHHPRSGRADGKALLERLVRSAHFLIESGGPGELAALGLGYDELAALNPALIVVSITPFGQTGPYATYSASRSGRHGARRIHVRDGRSRPGAAAGRLSAFLPARRGRRRDRRDARARAARA